MERSRASAQLLVPGALAHNSKRMVWSVRSWRLQTDITRIISSRLSTCSHNFPRYIHYSGDPNGRSYSKQFIIFTARTAVKNLGGALVPAQVPRARPREVTV